MFGTTLRSYICPPPIPLLAPLPASEWFLDRITPHHLVPYLPAIYQAFLLPARLLYHLAGPDKARAFDQEYDVQGKGRDKLSFFHFISTLMAAVQFWVFSPGKDGAGSEL